MNLQEYINQKNPQRLSVGSVELKDSEYTIVGSTASTKLVHINGYNWYYILINGNNILFTGDDQGNPKSASVFKIN